MEKLLLLLLASSMLSASFPAWSHHSFAAQYDVNQPIELVGKVTKVEWTNPHARFYIDVADSSGADMANAESIILSSGRQVFGRNSADNR